MVDPGYFAPFNFADSYGKGLAIREHEQQSQNRKRLGDLLPVITGMNPGGAIDESGATQAGRDAAMREVAQINPELFLKLNEQQKAQAAAELDDVSAAVRWADTPEKWAQVQQYYGSHGHDASGYSFENRESYLLQLGKMGDYLKSASKPEYRTIEAGGSLIDVSNGQPRVVIAPNDGSYQTGAPAQDGNLPRVSDQQSYDAVPPGQKYMTPDGHVRVKQGGQSASPAGGFPY